MLSSITPLGQRSRGFSWRRTVVAFWVGALLASVGLFSLLGWLGGLASLNLSVWIGVALVGAAAILDLLGVKAPGPQRQVDEDWLNRYRDWVTGFGFGAQLGLGFMTIVPTWGTWAVMAGALVVGLPEAAMVGLAFGLGRSVLLIATQKVRSPGDLVALMSRFNERYGLAKGALRVGYVLFLVVAVANGV